MKEVIAELLNSGYVTVYNLNMVNDLIIELDNMKIDYSFKNYVVYVFFALN